MSEIKALRHMQTLSEKLGILVVTSFCPFCVPAALNSSVRRRLCRPPLISQFYLGNSLVVQWLALHASTSTTGSLSSIPGGATKKWVLFKTKGLTVSHYSSLMRLLTFASEVFKLFIEICLQKNAHIISVQHWTHSVTDSHVNKKYVIHGPKASFGHLSTHLPQRQPLSWLLTASVNLPCFWIVG